MKKLFKKSHPEADRTPSNKTESNKSRSNITRPGKIIPDMRLDLDMSLDPDISLDTDNKISKSFIDNSDDLLIQMDNKGNLIFVNKTVQKHLGLNLKQSKGLPALNFIRPDDRKIIQNKFLEWLKSKEREVHYSNRLISDRGDISDFSWKIIFEHDASKRVKFIIGIGKNVSKEKLSKQRLKKTTLKLKERVKELKCLYAISKLIETPDLTIKYFMQSIVDIIPPSFQYPDITCAVANINNTSFKTKFFKNTKWNLSSPIYVNKKQIGYLEVFYTKKMPILAEGPFLIEERDLIDEICERIGNTIERIQTHKALKEIEKRYQTLTNQFADGIVIIQNERYKFVNTAFSSMVGYMSPKYLIEKKYHKFISKDFRNLYNESILTQAKSTKTHNTIEYKLLTKNGKEIWVEEKRNEINWAFAPAILCTLRDITLKKEKEVYSIEETKQLRSENILLRSSLKERYRFQNIIGVSSVMQHVYDQILSAANSNANVSIYGESGTGKELVAKAIHDLSNKGESTFITINCGAIPESLMESEFFGHKKGAFTGATLDKPGFLDLADNGTLFLDEIGEIPLSMQVKLLRAIDGGGYNPIGSNEKRMSNFRIIAATNQDLKEEVIKGKMREDFFYRIQVIPITLPPLRDRREDIPFLVEHFTQKFSKTSKFNKVPDNIKSQIYDHEWAGNIRELQNVLLRFFSTGQFELIGFNKSEPKNINKTFYEAVQGEESSLSQFIEIQEKAQIVQALQATNWHRTNTAAQLGMSRSTLFRKIKKYGLPLKQTVRF